MNQASPDNSRNRDDITDEFTQQVGERLLTIPIPKEYLDQLPELPLGVDTWGRINDLLSSHFFSMENFALVQKVFDDHVEEAVISTHHTFNIELRRMRVLQLQQKAQQYLQQLGPVQEQPLWKDRSEFAAQHLRGLDVAPIGETAATRLLSLINRYEQAASMSQSQKPSNPQNEPDTQKIAQSQESDTAVQCGSKVIQDNRSRPASVNTMASRRQSQDSEPGCQIVGDAVQRELRAIKIQAERNPVQQSDFTNTLTSEQKTEVTEIMKQSFAYYKEIDQFVVLFYMFSRSPGQTLQLFQLKIAFASQWDALNKGRFLTDPALAKKTRVQFSTYVNYVGEEIEKKRQQERSQKQQVQEENKQPQEYKPTLAKSGLDRGKASNSVSKSQLTTKPKRKKSKSSVKTSAKDEPTAEPVREPKKRKRIAIQTSKPEFEVIDSESANTTTRQLQVKKDKLDTAAIPNERIVKSKLQKKQKLTQRDPLRYFIESLGKVLNIPEEHIKRAIKSELETPFQDQQQSLTSRDQFNESSFLNHATSIPPPVLRPNNAFLCIVAPNEASGFGSNTSKAGWSSALVSAVTLRNAFQAVDFVRSGSISFKIGFQLGSTCSPASVFPTSFLDGPPPPPSLLEPYPVLNVGDVASVVKQKQEVNAPVSAAAASAAALLKLEGHTDVDIWNYDEVVSVLGFNEEELKLDYWTLQC